MTGARFRADPSTDFPQTIFVSSSTNNGTPSVLFTICCTTSAGSALAAGDLLYHQSHVASAQPTEDELAEIGMGTPRRRKLRPKGQYGKHACRRHLLQKEREQFQSGRVGPVQILPRIRHGLLLSLGTEPGDKRFVGLLFLLLRARKRGVL